MMRVLICGDRNWTEKQVIMDVLKELELSCVIEGGARGADILARECADKLHILVVEYAADWAKYGKAAGPIRNKKMIVYGKPDRVIAFHNDIEHSKGTKSMIHLALQYKIPVTLYCMRVGKLVIEDREYR